MPWDDRIKRRLKLRDLDILMAVIDAKSMGKAAGRLNMSQPAISKAVADLEQALGVRLLNRSYQGVEPTPYGRALIKRSVVLFNELRQGVQDIESLADPTAGELRIGATEGIAAAIVVPIIERLSRQYPRMTFYVVGGDQTGALYRHVAERNVEMALSRIADPLPKEYSADVLFHDSLVIAAGASNPLTRQRNLKLAELVVEPWIQQPSDNSFASLSANIFAASRIPPPRLTVSSSSPTVRNGLLATGRFLTMVPGFTLRLPRKHATLKPLPVELPNSRHPVAIITLKGLELSPPAQLFVTHVRALTKPLAKENN